MKRAAIALWLLLGCQPEEQTPILIAGSAEALVAAAIVDAAGVPTAAARLDDRAIAPFALGPGERLVTFTVPRDKLLGPEGQPLPDALLAQAQVQLIGARAASGGCGRCTMPAYGDRQLVNPGDACPPPAFAKVQVSDASTPDPVSLEAWRTALRIDWPGSCACSTPSLIAGAPLRSCPLYPAEAPWTIDWATETDDHTLVVFQPGFVSEIDPDGTSYSARIVPSLAGEVLRGAAFSGGDRQSGHAFLLVTRDRDVTSTSKISVALVRLQRTPRGSLIVAVQPLSAAHSVATSSIQPVPSMPATIDLFGAARGPFGLRCTLSGTEVNCRAIDFDVCPWSSTIDALSEEVFQPGDGAIIGTKNGFLYRSADGQHFACDTQAQNPPLPPGWDPGIAIRWGPLAGSGSNLLVCGEANLGGVQNAVVLTATVTSAPIGNQLRVAQLVPDATCINAFEWSGKIQVLFNDGNICQYEHGTSVLCQKFTVAFPGIDDGSEISASVPGDLFGWGASSRAYLKQGSADFRRMFGPPPRDGRDFVDAAPTATGFVALGGGSPLSIQLGPQLGDCASSTIAAPSTITSPPINGWPPWLISDRVAVLPDSGDWVITGHDSRPQSALNTLTLRSQVGLVSTGSAASYRELGPLEPQAVLHFDSPAELLRSGRPSAAATLGPKAAVLAGSGGALLLLREVNGAVSLDPIPALSFDPESGQEVESRPMHWLAASSAGSVVWVTGEEAIARVTLGPDHADAVVFLLDRITSGGYGAQRAMNPSLGYFIALADCADHLLFGSWDHVQNGAERGVDQPFLWEIAPECTVADVPYTQLARGYRLCRYDAYHIHDDTSTRSIPVAALGGPSPTLVFTDGVLWRSGFRERTEAPIGQLTAAARDSAGRILIGAAWSRLAVAFE